MKRIRTLAIAALAAASLGTATVSFAHPEGGWGPGAGHGPGAGRGPGFFGNQAGPAANVEARLANLRAQLNITAAQESAWQAYAAAVTAQAQQMQSFRDQAQSATTAPDRHALMTQHMQQRATGMANVGQALNGLYALLTAEQRTILDQRGHFAGGPRGPRGGWRG